MRGATAEAWSLAEPPAAARPAFARPVVRPRQGAPFPRRRRGAVGRLRQGRPAGNSRTGAACSAARACCPSWTAAMRPRARCDRPIALRGTRTRGSCSRSPGASCRRRARTRSSSRATTTARCAASSTRAASTPRTSAELALEPLRRGRRPASAGAAPLDARRAWVRLVPTVPAPAYEVTVEMGSPFPSPNAAPVGDRARQRRRRSRASAGRVDPAVHVPDRRRPARRAAAAAPRQPRLEPAPASPRIRACASIASPCVPRLDPSCARARPDAIKRVPPPWPGSSMVEQETLNLWVEGSSPSRVTKSILN